MSILEVKNLRKRFGDNEVLRGIDLTLERGEVLAIIGSSGGGKTTLLRCLNFLEKADEGEIWVNGKQVYLAKEGEKPTIAPGAQLSMGLVFQQFNLFPQYSVMKNLTLAPTLMARRAKSGESADNIEKKARELLETVGLSEKADAYPCQLSGGQQQRVAIARALMLSPDILCFDEPTSALDPELTGEVLRVIRSLKNSDRTMIIVTHEMEFARNVADKVIFVADGIIEEEGTAEDVLLNPKSEKIKQFLSVVKKEDL
jgi:polar amino acid transport system ATP-binding protein